MLYENNRVFNELGANIFKNGYKRAAISIMLKAYEASSMNESVANNIGVVYTHLGELNKTAHFFGIALERSQKNKTIIENVAILLKIFRRNKFKFNA